MKIHEIIKEALQSDNKQNKKVSNNPDAPTFGGKDPLSFKSPNGGTPIIMFVTGQGSRYLIADDGMVLRLKSFHANTGGEDQGLKEWRQHIEFYDPSEQLGGTTFPMAVATAVEKRLPVTLGKTKDGKRVLLLYKDNAWKPAKISDIFKHVATHDVPIVATYSTKPKLNWNPLDFNLNGNKILTSVHPGSSVTHGTYLKQSVEEDWQSVNKKDKTDGMSKKAVNTYRKEHPGSKLKTAVTKDPSKLKKGSKDSNRRKSYCSRSAGQQKMHNISCSKTPDKPICKARRRWNCE